ncbi:ESX secretion-associated protein EspG [Nocardia blacklockiae]|uniref:ESX secretion-associated protein EspG n=1 Tax=Nocardia blacklockiae TaxID=480036 RepID=UPI002B4ACAC5|nr:ESX secretion-associated protein EspG [Nocardia blacklockiae]
MLWDSTGRDVLPYPLVHRFTEESTWEEVNRTRQRVARTVLPQLDEDLERAVAVLLAPEARVEVSGFVGRRRERRIRIHGAVHDRHGAIAVQEPGPEDGVGGDVRLTFLPAERLASALIAQLPECAAGQGKTVSIPVEELDRPAPQDPWVVGPRDQLARLFNRPASATFHIAVYPWGSPDNRHTEGRKDFQIIDWIDDGRYASFGDRTVTVKPTDSARMIAQVRQMLSRTVAEVRSGKHPRP